MLLLDSPSAKLYSEGKFAEAEQSCSAALAQNPNDVAAINNLAIIRATQQRLADSLAILRQMTSSYQSVAIGWYNLGFVARALGDVQTALGAFRTAANLTDFAEASLEFGKTVAYHSRHTNLYPESQEQMRKATRIRPDWAEAHYELGSHLIHSSHDEEAEVALKRALELRPHWPDAQWRLCVALMEQDKAEEAIPLLEAVLAANPAHEEARRNLDRLREAKRAAKRDRLALYPRSHKEFDDLQKVIDQYILPEFRNQRPVITRNSKIFTMGSCFAANIAEKLKRCGVETEYLLMTEEINNSYANRYFLEWLQGKVDNKYTRRFAEVYEGTHGKDYIEHLRETVRNAEMVIYSLGVAPCFFEKDTGDFALTLGENLHASLLAKNFDFRTTTVKENFDNLTTVIEILREFNPYCHIMLTVSPVPLKATFERPSAVLADCVSKSTLRVVAHEIMELKIPRVHYWPSFEIVKWLGCHIGPVFGLDDNSPLHPNDDLISMILNTFLRIYAESDVIEANVKAQEAWDRVGVGASGS